MPVISTPVGGITRAICHGSTGILVEPGDVASLQAAMTDLALDHEKRESISRQARIHVENNFNANTQLAKIIAIYDDLLGKSS